MSDVEDEEFGSEEDEEIPFDEGQDDEDDMKEDDDEDKDEDEQQAEEQEEEEEDKMPDVPLTAELAREGLALLQRVGTGLSHAYVSMDLRTRDLTDVELIKSYIHLRYLNVSDNYLTDLSCVSALQNLLQLTADTNRLKTAALEDLPYLQAASFNTNKIKAMDGIAHPLLEKLSLEHNEISRVSFSFPEKLSCLRVLDLRGNKLETTLGEYPPNLEELYLGANLITKLEGLEQLTNLKRLHLRDNQLTHLDGFSQHMVSLQYLNVRGNSIEEIKEVKKLRCLPALVALVLAENPLSEGEDYRIDVCVALEVNKRMAKLDKDAFNQDELEEAKTNLLEALEVEAAEKAAEEAAAAAAALAADTAPPSTEQSGLTESQEAV